MASLFKKAEEAQFELLETTSKYEVRKYPVQKWATTKMADIKQNSAFWKCYGYINGKNDSKTKIDMTTPVSIQMTGDSKGMKSETMSFFVPGCHQTKPPAPEGEDVSIEERPEMTVFVRQYGGYSNDVKVAENLAALKSDLQADKRSYREDAFYYAGYDPPFKPFYRRNEVWLLKSD